MKKVLMAAAGIMLMAGVSFAADLGDRISLSLGGAVGVIGGAPGTLTGLDARATLALTRSADLEFAYGRMTAVNMERYTSDVYDSGGALLREVRVDRSHSMAVNSYLASVRIGRQEHGFRPYVIGGGGFMTVDDRRTDVYDVLGNMSLRRTLPAIKGGLGFVADMTKSLAIQVEGSYLAGPVTVRQLTAGFVYRL